MAMVVVAALATVADAALADEPAFSYLNPFHREQCWRAERYAAKALKSDPTDKRARVVLAEALLCRGLDGDRWSLTAAIEALADLSLENPDDFFVRLALADAYRKKYPASDRAVSLLADLTNLLTKSNVGDARGRIERHIRQNAAASKSLHRETLTRLQSLAGDARREHASDEMVLRFVTLVARLGPRDRTEAKRFLLQRIDSGQVGPLVVLAEAELSLGDRDPNESRAMFQRAEESLCRIDASDLERNKCALARRRLRAFDQYRWDSNHAVGGVALASQEGRRE